VTAPLIVMLPPWAQINPEFAISLLTMSPPLPVASSVPLLVTTWHRAPPNQGGTAFPL
jgi:hypothetical protein